VTEPGDGRPAQKVEPGESFCLRLRKVNLPTTTCPVRHAAAGPARRMLRCNNRPMLTLALAAVLLFAVQPRAQAADAAPSAELVAPNVYIVRGTGGQPERANRGRVANAAFVVGDVAYLARTWHPRTRPADLDAGNGHTWRGLTVIATADGREGDSVGEVEFEAAHDEGVLHERSRFIRRAGRWVYVDGDVRD